MQAKPPETTKPRGYDLSLFELQARFARVMGHAGRLHILHLLVHAPDTSLSGSELRSATGLSKSAISQHLEKMASVGLVKTRRDGRFLRVRLAEPEIGQACELIRIVLAKFAADRQSAIDAPEHVS